MQSSNFTDSGIFSTDDKLMGSFKTMNSLNSTDDGIDILNDTFIKVIQIIMIPISAFSVIVNTMAIIAIVVGVPAKRPVHKLLISVSLSDCLLSLAIVLVGRRVLVCEIAGVCVVGGTAAELTLFMLALDQYVAICHPFRHPIIFSPTRTHILIGYLWTNSLVSGLVYYIVSITSNERSDNIICIGISQFERIWFFISSICLHLILLPIFAFLYTRVFLEVRKIDKVPNRSRSTPLINIKGMLTTLIIAGIFMMMFLPMSILTGIVSLGILDRLTATRFVFGFFLSAILNSIFDPFLYTLRLPDVREGYRRVYFPKRRATLTPLSEGTSN